MFACGAAQSRRRGSSLRDDCLFCQLVREGDHVRSADGFVAVRDINPKAVEWCRSHLDFAEVALNEIEPPLPYPAQMFDFVYALSVFTHLDEDLQHAWLREFGVAYVADVYDEMSDSLVRAIRRIL